MPSVLFTCCSFSLRAFSPLSTWGTPTHPFRPSLHDPPSLPCLFQVESAVYHTSPSWHQPHCTCSVSRPTKSPYSHCLGPSLINVSPRSNFKLDGGDFEPWTWCSHFCRNDAPKIQMKEICVAKTLSFYFFWKSYFWFSSVWKEKNLIFFPRGQGSIFCSCRLGMRWERCGHWASPRLPLCRNHWFYTHHPFPFSDSGACFCEACVSL